MKMNFKIGTMEIKEFNITTPEVEVELDFSLTEAVGIYDLKKQLIKDLPEMLIDLKASADKFVELDKEFKGAQAQEEECIIAKAKDDAVKEVIEKFRKTFYYDDNNSSGANGAIADIDGFLKQMQEEVNYPF